MKFKRETLRHEPLTITNRKVSAFARKQAREASALPLFAEQIREQQHDWNTELQRRERANAAFVSSQRALCARFWRKARSAYFALPVEARAACKAEWDAWRGGHTPTNCIYVIEKYNGVAEARRAALRAEVAAMNARIKQKTSAQPSLV